MITYESFENLVENIIREVINLDIEHFNKEQPFSEYGLDSLDHMTLFVEIEKELNLDLSDVDFKSGASCEDLYNEITKLETISL